MMAEPKNKKDDLDRQLEIAKLLKRRDPNFHPYDHYLNIADEILQLFKAED